MCGLSKAGGREVVCGGSRCVATKNGGPTEIAHCANTMEQLFKRRGREGQDRGPKHHQEGGVITAGEKERMEEEGESATGQERHEKKREGKNKRQLQRLPSLRQRALSHNARATLCFGGRWTAVWVVNADEGEGAFKNCRCGRGGGGVGVRKGACVRDTGRRTHRRVVRVAPHASVLLSVCICLYENHCVCMSCCICSLFGCACYGC
jgi:hypothetical protein